MAEAILKRELMIKPSECNARRELPLTMLVAQMIDLATDHANELGIGFLFMEPRNLGWVLSRLSVEMKRWPRNGELYVLSTWIESYNPHYSERCFSVTTPTGEVLGYGRTIWMIIDLTTHKSVGTAGTVVGMDMLPGIDCPIPRMARHKAFIPDRETAYTFQYTDIDFYRHVNTVKYVALLLNQYSMEEFDSSLLSRFDIAFAHEAKYGETVTVRSMEEDVTTPALLDHGLKSRRRIFDLTIEGQPILSASVVLSK